MREEIIVNSAHGIRRESASEAGKGAMIWRRLIKRDAEKLLKGDSVVDLGFQFRVGVNTEPLLEEETFQKEQRRIDFISFVTLPVGVISDQDAIDTRPIDNGIDFLHSFDREVTFERIDKSDVGKGKVGIDFFEAHSSSKTVNGQKLWQKN